MKSECVYVSMHVCSTKLRIPLETAKIDPHSETKLRMEFSELCLATSDCKFVYETNKASGLHSAHIIFFLWIFSIAYPPPPKARRFGSSLFFRPQSGTT